MNVEDVSKISYKPSHITQGAQYCDKFNSIIYKNAEKCRIHKKTPKISSIQNVHTNILVKKGALPMLTKKTGDITYNNMQLNNTCSISNNNDVSSNVNKTYVINDTLNDIFIPLAESTFKKEQLTSKCEIHDINTEFDISITSKKDIDDSFHLSDCSMPEDTDEDETENIREYTTNTSKSEIVNSTLNLTSSNSSKVVVCDDKNMYVETSDNPKSKRNMCLYCKKFQTQLTRHLESVHKTEEDVKKFCFLPKGKLYVICKVANNTISILKIN